eukprot:gene3939-4916_t
MSEELVTCTFVKTGRKVEVQEWYDCKTCGQVGSAGCCASCALVCHYGHNLSAVKNSKFYCDCGVGKFKVKNGLCKCLTPTPSLATKSADTAPVDASAPGPVAPSNDAGAIDRKDVKSLASWKTKLVEKFDEFKAKYADSNSATAAKFIQETTDLLANADEVASVATLDKDIEEAIKVMKPMSSALEGALSRKDIKSAQRWIKDLKEKYTPFQEKYSSYRAAKAFIETVEAIWVKVDLELSSFIAEKEIEDSITEITPMIKALEGAVSRKDVKSAINWTNKLKQALNEFKSKFAIYDASQRFIQDATTVLLESESEFFDLIQEENINNSINEMKPMVSALKGGLERKDINSTVNWKNSLLVKFNPFQEKYGSNVLAQRFVNDVNELLQQLSTDLGSHILEKEINDSISSMNSMVNSLKGGMERKDLDSISRWKNSLTPLYNQFKSKYGDSNFAAHFITSTNDLLEKIKSDLGAVILEKDIADRCMILKPQLLSLKGSFERKDIPAIVNKKKVLEKVYGEFLSEFGSAASENPITREVKDLLELIDRDLGSAIAEKEIQEQISTITISVNALNGAVSRSDLTSVANWKRVLADQFTPFQTKFGTNSLAARFINEVNELNAKVESQFGKELLETTTKKLQELQVKASSVSSVSSAYPVASTVGSTSSPSLSSTAPVSDGTVQCVNKGNPRPKLKQDLYMCLTCYNQPGQTQIHSICLGCRDVCHAGHEIGPMLREQASCACGSGFFSSKNGPCQCLDSREYPRQTYEPVAWVKRLGIPTYEEYQFILYAYDYQKKIEQCFKEKDLNRIASLMEGVYSIANQLDLNLEASAIKGLVDHIKSIFSENTKNLLNEFWPITLKQFKEKNPIKARKPKDVAEERDDQILSRHFYFDRFKLIPWGFIQATPEGRKLYSEAWATMEANTKLVKNFIPWSKDPTPEEKEQVDEYWNQFQEITKDPVPSFDMIEPLEKLLQNYTSKLANNRYFYEYKIYTQDLITYLTYAKAESRLSPDIPHLLGSSFDKTPDNCLYELFHENWPAFFSNLKKVTKEEKEYSTSFASYPRSVERRSKFVQEFYDMAVKQVKEKSLPLVIKYDNKGDEKRADVIIEQFQKYLADDAEFKETHAKSKDIRSRRANALKDLVAKDQQFRDILSARSKQFKPKVEEYMKKVDSKDSYQFNVEKQLVPGFDQYKGKYLEFVNINIEKGGGDPVKTIYETRSGIWFLDWEDEVGGGEDYSQLQEISNQLMAKIFDTHNVLNKLSKHGNDALHLYMTERLKVTRSKLGWTAVGKLKAVHPFTSTVYSSADSEAGALMMMPPGARMKSMNKEVSGYTTDTTHVRGHGSSYALETRTTHYTYNICFEVDKVGIDVEIDGFICDYFSSLKDGSKTTNSLTGVHEELRKLIPK